MDKLIIVGAGGHGRCCLDIARETYKEIAFLDDGLVDRTINDCKVIGKIEDMKHLYPQYKNIFIAIGNNAYRKELYLKAKQIGFNVVTLISNKATVSRYASINDGCVIFPNAVVEANATVGKNCIICANVTINHDAVIHDDCLINSGSIIRPMVELKERTHISSRCLISKSLEKDTFIHDGEVV